MADVDAKDIGLIDTPDAIKDKRSQVSVLWYFCETFSSVMIV